MGQDHRLVSTFLVTLVLAVALAGCGKRPSGAPLTDVEEALRTTPGKVLHGTVMTDEVMPLQATVELLDSPQNLTTDATGAYLFAGLESRDYLVKVSAPGYYPKVQRAAMMLGRDFRLDFILKAVPTGEPRHETQLFQGFIACQLVIATDFPGWIRPDCGLSDPNNDRQHAFTFDKHSSGFVVEVLWEPTTACAARLDFGLYLLMGDGPSHPLAEEFVSPGDRIFIPPGYFAPRGTVGGEVLATLAAERCRDIGGPGLSAGFVTQQPVDVYFTAFYFQDVPPDFSVRDA